MKYEDSPKSEDVVVACQKRMSTHMIESKETKCGLFFDFPFVTAT